MLLTGDSDGKVKLWNGETLRNMWTLGDDDDDEDDARASILGIEVVEDNEEAGRYAFVTHGRDGSARLWVSSSSDKTREKKEMTTSTNLKLKRHEGDFFPAETVAMETDVEAHFRNRERMSHVLSDVKRGGKNRTFRGE